MTIFIIFQQPILCTATLFTTDWKREKINIPKSVQLSNQHI